MHMHSHTHTLTIKDMSPSALGMWEINSQLEKTVSLSSVGGNGAAAIITTSADHDFAAGDIVAYEKGSSPIPGLIPGRNYKVATANLAATTFSLTELDGTAITYGQLTAAGYGSGTGAKFHLSTLAGAPNVAEREAQLQVQMFWPLRTLQSMVMSERKQQILQSVRPAGILQLR